MGSAFGRILGRSSTVSSATKSAAVRRPQEPTIEAEPSSPVDPSLHQPDTQLLDKLKDVYVESSTNVVTQENPYGSERIVSSKLPQDRTPHDEDTTFDQITTSTEGYLTAQEVLEIFNKRATDTAGEWTEQKIATDYKISPEDATNLVKYFGSYRVLGALPKREPEMKLHPLHR